MKRKVWVTSPIAYIMAGIMFLMALASLSQNLVLCFVELALAVICLITVFIGDRWFGEHVARSMAAARRVLTAEETRMLEKFTLPVAVVANEKDIVWANELFEEAVSHGECRGDSILRYIYPYTLRQILAENGANTECGGRKYTVYASKTEAGAVLYFIDNTYYKDIQKEYRERSAVVAAIAFDNREEMTRDSSSVDDSRIVAEVETTLRNWATQDMEGVIRKLSNGRYLLLSDEIHLQKAREKRFDVLDEVRRIRNQNLFATVSIGIGRGASNMGEAELWARQALNMALGRGGDQVAVKQNDTYEFFGGLSKGVEKRDKVRTRVIAATLADHIRSSDKVLIMGHRFSDLDSVGSAVGIWAVVKKGLGRNAFIVVNRGQSLAHQLIDQVDEAYPETKIFISNQEALQVVTGKTVVVVVDTHSVSLVECPELIEDAQRLIVIDHHRMTVNYIQNTLIFYHEPYASSASEMVTELVQYINANCLSAADAQALLSGIALDTKNFVMKTGVRTFEASAYLRRRGADTVAVKRLFSGTLDTYKAKSHLVEGAELYKGCAIAYTEEALPEIRVAAAQAADELLSISGVEASFVIYRTDNAANFSARSLGDVNVQILMEALGGGGHYTMSGARLENTTAQEAVERLKKVLDEKLEQATNTGGK